MRQSRWILHPAPKFEPRSPPHGVGPIGDGGIWVKRGHVRENIRQGGTMTGLPSPAIHRAYAKWMTVICPPLEEYEQAAMPPPAGGDFSRSRQIKGASLAFLRSLECISVGSSS